MEVFRTLGEWVVSGLILLGLVAPSSVAPAPAPVPEPTREDTTFVYQIKRDRNYDIDVLQNEIDYLKLQLQEMSDMRLGADLPGQDALVDTYLTSNIAKTDTTMTLASGTTRDGETLAGWYCFTIDANSSTVEYVCGTASSTSVTGLQRGIKASNPNATSSSLAFSHRRFASVQVTDFPFNQLTQRRLNGIDPFEDLLYYTGISTTTIAATSTSVVPTRAYVDFVGTSGCGNADTATRGCIEYATQLEAASSTVFGSTGARLGISAEMSTSSPGSEGIWNVITGNSGNIQSTFLDGTAEQYTFGGATTTVTGSLAHATTTQFGVYGGIAPVGSMIAYASTTPPAGWLLCNGASLLRAQYSQLFAVIGTSYGAADGTHFTLPNLLGRTPVMASTTANIGQTGGEDRHTMIEAELAPHTHTEVAPSGSLAPSGGSGTMPSAYGSVASGSTGSSTPFNVRDPYLAVQYIIKY